MNDLRLRIAGLTLAALAVSAGSSVSAGSYALPAGCTGKVTVQQRSCLVSHIFTCSNDPEGYTRRVDLDDEGMTYVGAIDSETQWIESFSPRAGDLSMLDEGARDAASFSELLETGIDTYDFTTSSNAFGTTRYIGTDKLTGETETIDGVTLERTEFDIRAFDSGGRQIWEARGKEYINREWRVFFSGQRTVTDLTSTFEEDDRPVTFSFPGDAGFLASEPQYDCGAILSSAEPVSPLTNANSQAWLQRVQTRSVLSARKEINHDRV